MHYGFEIIAAALKLMHSSSIKGSCEHARGMTDGKAIRTMGWLGRPAQKSRVGQQAEATGHWEWNLLDDNVHGQTQSQAMSCAEFRCRPAATSAPSPEIEQTAWKLRR
jgi:hypothetical protein